MVWRFLIAVELVKICEVIEAMMVAECSSPLSCEPVFTVRARGRVSGGTTVDRSTSTWVGMMMWQASLFTAPPRRWCLNARTRPAHATGRGRVPGHGCVVERAQRAQLLGSVRGREESKTVRGLRALRRVRRRVRRRARPVERAVLHRGCN